MSIPASIVDRTEWLGRAATHHDPTVYRGGWTGRWVPLVSAQTDEMERLMVIDVAGDPVYSAFEIQLFRSGETVSAVALAARKGGGIDYYYQPHHPMSAERLAGLRAMLNEPRFYERDFTMRLEVGSRGLVAMLDLIDEAGRRIYFNVVENAEDRHLSAILAPVSNHAREPKSFPLVYLDQFSMVLKRNTTVEIEVDGARRRPVVFPIWVDGHRVYYSRYATRVVIADLLPENRQHLEMVQLQPNQESVNLGSSRFELSWNTGHPEIRTATFRSGVSESRLHFQPPLPQPTAMRAGATANGRFVLSVNDVDAVIAGEYEIEGGHETARFVVQPLQGWQPPGMGRRRWVSTFRYEAALAETSAGVQMAGTWFRTD